MTIDEEEKNFQLSGPLSSFEVAAGAAAAAAALTAREVGAAAEWK